MSLLCDLHAHTTASDGSYTPSQLVDYAQEKGLSALAVTDHDTVTGLAEALARGREVGLRIIPGIELATEVDGRVIHLTGLLINLHSPALAEMMDWQKETRRRRNKALIQTLMEMGFDISFDDFPETPGRNVSRTHIGDLLARRGYGASQREVDEKYLNPGCPAYVRRESLEVERCIEIIHDAGGLAFVAHPNRISKRNRDMAADITRRIIALGADGLETRYSEFDEDWRARADAIARETGCLRSGGSDFHGSYKKELDLGVGFGNLEVPLSFLEEMENRIQR